MENLELELAEVLQAPPTAQRWQTYGEYKDSGVQWLGMVPAHWEIRRLKYTAEIIMGQSPDSNDCNLVGIGVPFLQGKAEFGSLYPSPKIWCQVARKIARPDDILLSVRAPVGEINVADQSYGIGRGLCSITPSKQLVKVFLWFLLHVIREGLTSISTGSTYDAVSVDEVRNLICFIPSLPEQRAIAAFLDRETAHIDALLAKKEQLIALLLEKRAALISQAMTRGLNPAARMKDSGVQWLGMVPEHWEVRRVKYLSSILRGKFSHRPRNDPRFYDGPYPFIQTGDITAANRYITEYQQTLNELGFSVSKLFPKGTLVMSIAANIGDLAILQFESCFPDSIVGFVPNASVIREFLYYSLMAMKQEIMGASTINTQSNINIEQIGTLFTACPPISEQKSIVAYIDRETTRIDLLISRIREAIQNVKEYRVALISAAVTGKIDVRGEMVASMPTHAAD